MKTMQKDRKIKGSLLKDVVKGIKIDKVHEEEYNTLLSDSAKQFMNQRILASIWYSWDMYCELYKALVKVVAKNNTKIVTKWGHDYGENVIMSIYKNIITEGNVKKLVETYPRFHKMFYNFGAISLEWIADNELMYTVTDFEPEFKFWYYTNLGWTQIAIELCINKKVNYEFLKKSWEGDDETQVKLFWTT